MFCALQLIVVFVYILVAGAVGAAASEDDVNHERQRLITQILDLQNTLDGQSGPVIDNILCSITSNHG